MADSSSTLTSLFNRRVAADGDRVAIHVPRDGAYEQLTWSDVARDVARAAAALRRAGVAPGDRVAQVSENRYEWIVVDLAVHQVRAVHVAIHAVLSGPQIAFQITDSDAHVVILSGPEQAAKLSSLPVPLPDGLTFFSHDECSEGIAEKPIRRFAFFVEETAALPQRVVVPKIEPKADDMATILYSSGTTGEPKGVMLTHGNLTSNATATCEAYDIRPDDVRLAFLPLSHIFARTCDLYTWLVGKAQLALAENRDSVIANCAVIQPTVLNGVPYFYEKVMRGLLQSGRADAPGILQKILGGRVRLCCSGGAALPDHVAQFFHERNVLLMQGYGLTESSPVITISTKQANRLGTVGRPIRDVEVRIAADGEVLTRGPHVMLGYWKRPDATADVIRDGWLHTGDLGAIDADGYLKITGRKKELIVTAGGKNIAPVAIEALLTEDPLIAQALVVGDGRNYLTALIVPNFDPLRDELAKFGPPHSAGTQPAELVSLRLVKDMYRQRIDERLSGVSRPEQVRRFTLLERPFSLEEGELTPTLKLRRSAIVAKFAPQIDAMYAEQDI